MNNQTNKPQDPGQFLAPMDEEHFHKNRISAIDYYAEIRLDIVFWIESKSHCFIKEKFPIYLCSQVSENIRTTISGDDLYINEDGSRTVCSIESNPGEITSAATPWAAQNNLIIGQKLSAVKSEIKRI